MNSRDPVTRDHAENRPGVESNYEILQKTLQMIFVLFIFFDNSMPPHNKVWSLLPPMILLQHPPFLLKLGFSPQQT